MALEVHRTPWFDLDGYRATTVFYDDNTKKTVLEHRKKMELKLGRRLKSNELVHHKDGNRKNNRDSNLELLSRSEHTRRHNVAKGIKMVTLVCHWCEKEFEREAKRASPEQKNGTARSFCNNRCKSAFAGSISKPPPR